MTEIFMAADFDFGRISWVFLTVIAVAAFGFVVLEALYLFSWAIFLAQGERKSRSGPP